MSSLPVPYSLPYRTSRHWRHPGGHFGLLGWLAWFSCQPLCGQWLLPLPSINRGLGPELSKMGKSEAFPNGSSHLSASGKAYRGAMRRIWGRPSGATVFWARCPNQTNEEQGVPGNDNRARGAKAEGVGARKWSPLGLSEEKFLASPHLTACLIRLLAWRSKRNRAEGRI